MRTGSSDRSLSPTKSERQGLPQLYQPHRLRRLRPQPLFRRRPLRRRLQAGLMGRLHNAYAKANASSSDASAQRANPKRITRVEVTRRACAEHLFTRAVIENSRLTLVIWN